MLRPANKPDWFFVDEETFKDLAAVPGAKQEGQRFLIHKTHLPLMVNNPEAVKLLLPSIKPEWDLRNKATADRGFTLRHAQHESLDYMLQRKGTLLGLDPRIGKTLASIMAHDPTTGPFVVICPGMVRPVWIGWLRRVFPGVPIGVLKGKQFDPAVIKNPIVVGHYDILHCWQSGAPIGTIVFDEAHFLANRNSRRSKAAVFLASRTVGKIIAATGTPIWNMPPDLWNVLGMLVPGAFGGYHDFAYRYGLPVPTAYGMTYTGISNEAELQARITQVMIRRRWVDVAEDLPPITRNVVLAEIDDKTRNKLDVMAAGLLEGSKVTAVGILASYREQLSKVKLPIIVKEALNCIERGEPVVVWTWHVDLAKKIHEALAGRSYLLTGDTPQGKFSIDGAATGQREEILANWRSSLTPSALICTMSVAQVGLDFSHAHLAILGEIDYTPAIIAQVEMRTYSPTCPMNLTYVIADHIVDQRIILALIRKLTAANPIGVGAANDAIISLRDALQGPVEEADMSRLLDDLLNS